MWLLRTVASAVALATFLFLVAWTLVEVMSA